MIARISRDDLRALIDRADPFVLLEALPASYFEDAHLPGAQNMPHDRVDAHLDEARGDEHGCDRESAVARIVEPERHEHVEGTEEERGQGVEPQPADKRSIRSLSM